MSYHPLTAWSSQDPDSEKPGKPRKGRRGDPNTSFLPLIRMNIGKPERNRTQQTSANVGNPPFLGLQGSHAKSRNEHNNTFFCTTWFHTDVLLLSYKLRGFEPARLFFLLQLANAGSIHSNSNPQPRHLMPRSEGRLTLSCLLNALVPCQLERQCDSGVDEST